MIRKRIYSKHFDLAHSIMFNEVPKLYTKTIGVPGVFVRKINRRVHLKDGTCGEMDSAYIADPDYKVLFEKVAVALEHQSMPVGDSKLLKFGDYDIQLVADEHLPTLLVVASHINQNKSKYELIRSPSDISLLYFLDLGEDNISQRLSTVTGKINSNQDLSMEDALNLGVIVLYAPRERACEITEQVVENYLLIVDDLDLQMEYILYSVITILIDAYFDDEKDYRRLIKMMDINTSQESKKIFAAHENTMESLKYAREDLDRVNGELSKANDELSKANDELSKANDELSKANDELSKSNGKLSAANDEIARLKSEVNRLTNELNAK